MAGAQSSVHVVCFHADGQRVHDCYHSDMNYSIRGPVAVGEGSPLGIVGVVLTHAEPYEFVAGRPPPVLRDARPAELW